jgi:hypothetical protein
MKPRILPWFAGLALFSAACVVGGSAGAGPEGSVDVITRAQMIEVNANTVYEAVQKLHPSWLTPRGPTSVTDPTLTVATVYLSGNRVGDVEYLRSLRPDDVDRVRYYEAGEASARFGMGNPRGVIEVIPRGDL